MTSMGRRTFTNFVDSSDLDDEDAEIMTMLKIREELEARGTCSKLQGSIKGRKVVPPR